MASPDGLKPQECERNAGWSRPPIPYIPKEDVIQEAMDTAANTLKLTLSHKVGLHVPVWSKGPPEQFLVNIQKALDVIRQKGLLVAYEKAIKDREECTLKLTKVAEAMVNYTGKYTNHPKEKAAQKTIEASTHAN